MLERIKTLEAKLETNKCEYLRPELEYYGHLLAKNGVKPNSPEAEVVKKFKIPTTVKDRIWGKYRNACEESSIGDVTFNALDAGSSDCTIKASAVIDNEYEIIRVASGLLAFRHQGKVVKSRGFIPEKVIIDNYKLNFSKKILTSDLVEIKSSQSISLKLASVNFNEVNVNEPEFELPFMSESKEHFNLKK